MKYCGVRHNKKNKKIYYFRLPEKLSYAKCGDIVVCDTACGRNLGKIVTVVEAENDAALHSVVGGKGAFRSIVSVGGKMVDIDTIKIPCMFRKKKPSNDKLIRRVFEFNARKGFNTRIAIDEEGYLRDGYSAYLTARFLGLKRFGPCIVVDSSDYNTTEYVEGK